MRALVTGATGLLGRRLVARLRDGAWSVSVLSRDAERARSLLGDVEAHSWEPEREAPPAAAFHTRDGGGVDVVFHLAGEPVGEGRWTDERKRRIRDSREAGTRNLVLAIEALATRPRALVSMSAVGYYGTRGEEILDESAASGDGFLASVCVAWEREAARAEALGLRVVRARVGVVLAEDGGALPRMLTPFKLGVGGRLGDGRQWMAWVHAADVVGLLVHAATCADASGPMNVVAPAPARNADFTRALGAALHRPALLAVPGAALRLGFGELATALLASQRVVPRVAERTGYRFLYPGLAAALAAALAPAR